VCKFYSAWEVRNRELISHFEDYDSKIAGAFHFPPSETEDMTLVEMKYWFDRAMDYFRSFNDARRK